MKMKDIIKEGMQETVYYLVYMELGAINSGKGKKYFVFPWELQDWQQGHPLGLRKDIDEYPLTQKFREEGYQGPDVVGSWKGGPDGWKQELADAKEQLADSDRMISSYKMQLQDTVKKLSQVEEIMNSGKLEN